LIYPSKVRLDFRLGFSQPQKNHYTST